MPFRTRAIPMILTLAVALAGCTAPDGENGDAEGAAVTAAGFAFDPATITVTAGTTVTWTNEDGELHTVTSDDGSFETASLAPNGGTGTVTFTEPGTYTYHCQPHPQMTGTVIVEA